VTVNIVVVANLVLDPPELYLMPGTVAELQLSQIRQGRAESIPFPSTQYYLEIDDPKVGSIIEASGSIKVLLLTYVHFVQRPTKMLLAGFGAWNNQC